MNQINLIGRLTRDPELRYTPNGVASCHFDLAVNRPVAPGKEREADFIRIIVWQKQAENAANYLKKGSRCAVMGRLQIRKYTDKDGQDRRVTEVIAYAVEFLDYNKGEETTPSSPEPRDYDGINLDDLPF